MYQSLLLGHNSLRSCFLAILYFTELVDGVVRTPLQRTSLHLDHETPLVRPGDGVKTIQSIVVGSRGSRVEWRVPPLTILNVHQVLPLVAETNATDIFLNPN